MATLSVLAVWTGTLGRFGKPFHQPAVLFVRGQPTLDQDSLSALCTTHLEPIPIRLLSLQEFSNLASGRMSQRLALRRFDSRVAAEFQVLATREAPQIAGDDFS